MSKQDREYLVQRRLTMYPQRMWEILQSALRSEGVKFEFAEWNQATAFRSRFYRFRMDAVEARVPGALRLADLEVTGVDGLGARYHAANSAPGPITLEFRYIGAEPPSDAVATQPQRMPERGEPFVPELDSPRAPGPQDNTSASDSAFDKVLSEWMKKEKP